MRVTNERVVVLLGQLVQVSSVEFSFCAVNKP